MVNIWASAKEVKEYFCSLLLLLNKVQCLFQTCFFGSRNNQNQTNACKCAVFQNNDEKLKTKNIRSVFIFILNAWYEKGMRIYIYECLLTIKLPTLTQFYLSTKTEPRSNYSTWALVCSIFIHRFLRIDMIQLHKAIRKKRHFSERLR